ncbi:MAG: dephospho-CoA kinase [Chloroflexi bacterium]|nr:dephospho-CoA kinase [Chloroflexota bacterium]
MVVIGLTGGIGAGKSEVSRILAGHGAVIIDTALLGHEAYAPGTMPWRAIIKAFGRDILLPDAQIDRKILGDIVFSDPEELDRLNAIMRPAIADMIRERLRAAERQGRRVTVIDSATLVEAGWTELVDEVWLATAPQDEIYRRLRLRSGLSIQAIAERMESQISDEERKAHADVVIANDGSLTDLRSKVESLWAERIQAKVGNHGAA